MFLDTLKELNKTKKAKYKFILKGGRDLRESIFHLFSIVWRSEVLPEGWCRTSLLQLYKGKKDFQDLANWRSIHLKEELPKMFSHLIVSQVKEKIMNSMTPFQIGAKKGHRAQEHIFLMKSMMQMFLMMKKPLIIQLYDVSKFFDKENLADVMTTVHEAGVKDKMYRLLTKLNEKRIIKVLTLVGETDEVTNW